MKNSEKFKSMQERSDASNLQYQGQRRRRPPQRALPQAERREIVNPDIECDWAAHDARIREHYAHARKKHPYFCDWVAPQEDTPEKTKAKTETTLAVIRGIINEGAEKHTLGWDDLLDCEVWEVFDALANGDKAHAVEECYDAIAVLLRVVDVLEGRQGLGKAADAKERAKKIVRPPDDTKVWIVYRAGAAGSLIVCEEKTWLGGVPFDCGPRQVEIKLLEDHTTNSDIDPRYIQPVAWFYTREEADSYAKEHDPVEPREGAGK